MEILVCAKRVPDTSENEIELNSAGTDIERDDLVYSINEFDNYAVEEAILIVTGAQAEAGQAQVGGMLAAMLDYPFASLVTAIEVLDSKRLKITREIEGGNKEISEIDLPCVLSIQTGINEPRYVGMRGILQVQSVPISALGAADLGVEDGAVGAAAARVKRLDYFVPPAGKGAEMLSGGRAEIIDRLIELLKARGGLQ